MKIGAAVKAVDTMPIRSHWAKSVYNIQYINIYDWLKLNLLTIPSTYSNSIAGRAKRKKAN